MTFMTLSQRIELEQGKRLPSEVKELNLDRSKASSIEGLTDDFTSLEVLSIANVGLESLSAMPKLPSLKTLELSGNAISGGLEFLVNCPNLMKLNLSSNKISSVESLTPLAKLSSLRSLDLSNCAVTEVENYRKTVFAALPNLKYLDGEDENNDSEPESEQQDGLVCNGVAEDANGAVGEEAADNDDDDDEHESDDDDEEYGIEALQRSDDLEDDDEEDYAPEEDEVESDEYDDDIDEEEDEEDDESNLSGTGESEDRRPAGKRSHDDSVDEASAAKLRPDDEDKASQ